MERVRDILNEEYRWDRFASDERVILTMELISICWFSFDITIILFDF